ncbi:MAG: PVC-type heme-binding CxxCH protein [Gemmataceae bacterium]
MTGIVGLAKGICRLLFVVILFLLPLSASAGPQRLKVLFLGDERHHQPRERLADILPFLAKSGMDVAYTDDLDDLNEKNLSRYDALVIYANHPKILPSQEKALIQYVEGGKGLVALHCASYCFLNSPKYVKLVGGQFLRHGSGVFAPKIAKKKHPALRSVNEFSAWDETYSHHRLTDDRDVLMYRTTNGKPEPWTWVRTQGKGRVFYTASGHDSRVFRQPEFQKLVAQGIRWASGNAAFHYETKPFERIPGEVPDYLGARKGKGDRQNTIQAPVPPAESIKHISVPGGFRAELFASEPNIVNPICINWDKKGRAWIVESVDYPNNRQPLGQGNDRITICEDTNGDGKADKFTVFADKLSIPTSIVHAKGGLIVAQAPYVLFLKDTDGDDKADVRKILFRGFGTFDTHAGPSNLRLGLDNWIYGTVGYSAFNGTVGGKRHRFRQGIFRFQADGSELEFLTSSSNNTWGLGIGEKGEIFYSTANGEHSSYLGIPNRNFESVRGWFAKGNNRMADHSKMHPITRIRQVDFFGGFTAAAGHAVYTARHFPKPFWNRVAFVCEPTGHLVHMCLLEKKGTNFVSRDRFNLFASTDEWTAPIAAEVGPDGAVWVLDWYNFIVQHNPTPRGFQTGKGNAYVTKLRDKSHGRIYRIVNTTAKPSQSHDLTKATPQDLVGALKSDNMFWRLHAQWELVARGKTDVIPDLRKLIASGKNNSTAAIHALHTIAGLQQKTDDSAKALRHPTPETRKAAIDVLPRTAESIELLLKAKALTDEDAIVRRQALLALSEMPTSLDAGRAIYAMLTRKENYEDRWIPLAATSAAAKHDGGFLVAALTAKLRPKGILSTVLIVAEHYARGNPGNNVEAVVLALKDAQPEIANSVLSGLTKGWPSNQTPQLSKKAFDSLVSLVPRLDAAGQIQLISLGRRWRLEKAFSKVLGTLRERWIETVGNTERKDTDRLDAARKLAQINPDDETIATILQQANVKASPEFSLQILGTIEEADSDAVAQGVLGQWGTWTPRLRQKGIQILLRRPEWTKALLTAIEKGQVPSSDLGVVETGRLAKYPDRQIARLAQKILAQGGRLPDPDRQTILETLIPLTKKTGDVARGREIFKKNCAKCHRHGNMGEKVGPELTGFMAHPKDKILTEIIDPNRSVEGNFRQYNVLTKRGQVLQGLLAGETQTAIELVDSEAKKKVVLREDIRKMIADRTSIMPVGFEKQLSKADFVDLLEFLTAKGKFVPLPLEKYATIVSTQGMFFNKSSTTERLIFRDWGPKTTFGVPFQLVDPKGTKVNNVILLHSPNGNIAPKMPKSVRIPCNTEAQAIHLLSGVSGWGYPYGRQKSVAMIVRLHYADGKKEDHKLLNGVHFADYIRVVNVPESKLAFRLRSQQIRYLAVRPNRTAVIRDIEFVDGDPSAPIVMAVTVERED